ncbi:IS66 family transposase [Corallococcus sp. M7]
MPGWRTKRRATRPKGPPGQAISYALKQWEALSRFLSDERLPLDNRSEAALRKAALGRKNFLFVGHEAAGENLEGLYALVATCEANGINPEEYLADVLLRVQTHPNSVSVSCFLRVEAPVCRRLILSTVAPAALVSCARPSSRPPLSTVSVHFQAVRHGVRRTDTVMATRGRNHLHRKKGGPRRTFHLGGPSRAALGLLVEPILDGVQRQAVPGHKLLLRQAVHEPG